MDLTDIKEIEKEKIKQDNAFLVAFAKMSTIELKIFDLAVANLQIKKNEIENNRVYVSKKSIFEFLQHNDNNKSSRLNKTLSKLQLKSQFKFEDDESFKGIMAIPVVEYNKRREYIIIEFQKDILSKLVNIKSNYTEYYLKDIKNLNSKYSIQIFKELDKHYKLFLNYNNIKERTPTISIDYIRKITDTQKKHKQYKDLNNNVIKKAIEDINNNTNYNIEYKPIKENGVTTKLQFDILNVSLKEETVKNNKEEKENINVLPEALTNKYIVALLEKGILRDKLHIEKNQVDLINTYNSVVPIYEMIDKKYCYVPNNSILEISVIDRHIEYMKDNKKDIEVNKSNISKYLKNSILNYEECVIVPGLKEPIQLYRLRKTYDKNGKETISEKDIKQEYKKLLVKQARGTITDTERQRFLNLFSSGVKID